MPRKPTGGGTMAGMAQKTADKAKTPASKTSKSTSKASATKTPATGAGRLVPAAATTTPSSPSAASAPKAAKAPSTKPKRMDKALYEAELLRLQQELVELQEWIKAEGKRLVVIFEGRDAAGKGGSIKRITEYLNPRTAQIVALPAPSERQQSQWYFQRYIEHLPAGGEIRLFDRSWYNRAGVERVMGYCTTAEHRRFLRQCPVFERMLIEDGIILRKYWFSVSDDEQERRFTSRLTDPMRRWKLSPTDLESLTRWEDYSRAKDDMFVHTDIAEARWNVVESNDKRAARINMIAHLLSSIPYQHIEQPELTLPRRPPSTGYRRTDRALQSEVPDHAADVVRAHADAGKGKSKGSKSEKFS